MCTILSGSQVEESFFSLWTSTQLWILKTITWRRVWRNLRVRVVPWYESCPNGFWAYAYLFLKTQIRRIKLKKYGCAKNELHAWKIFADNFPSIVLDMVFSQNEITEIIFVLWLVKNPSISDLNSQSERLDSARYTKFQYSHIIRWDNSKIITTNRRYHQRLCLEAWHINSAHAPLNRDDGGLLPDAYLHLVRKKAAN